MKRYKIILPTSEKCDSLGIRFEGMATRTQMWLMGVCSGVNFIQSSIKLNLILAGQSFVIETNDFDLINKINVHLSSYGCTVTTM